MGFIPYARLHTSSNKNQTNSYRYIQIHANARKYIQMHTHTQQYIQIHTLSSLCHAIFTYLRTYLLTYYTTYLLYSLMGFIPHIRLHRKNAHTHIDTCRYAIYHTYLLCLLMIYIYREREIDVFMPYLLTILTYGMYFYIYIYMCIHVSLAHMLICLYAGGWLKKR